MNKNQAGFTLLELLAAAAILLLLTGVAMPVGSRIVRARHEARLRAALQEMRKSVDRYKEMTDKKEIQFDPDTMGYPESLEQLVEGVDIIKGKKGRMRLLRRIPKDPISGKQDWGFLSSVQDPDSSNWDHRHVFDIYSMAEGKGLNGVDYREW